MLFTLSQGSSQSLLKVDWQEVVCKDPYISQVYAIANDQHGNTYTLGSFFRNTESLGEPLNADFGINYLTKQDKNGKKLFSKNLGGSTNFSFGDLIICANDELLIGLSFKDDFYLNGVPIANSVGYSSIVLMLDANFNLKWFQTFPSTKNSILYQLLLDDQENVYAAIHFTGSLSIQEKDYVQVSSYGTAIVKLERNGSFVWSHHFSAENNFLLRALEWKSGCEACPGEIVTVNEVRGDSVKANGKLLETRAREKFYNQHMLLSISAHGDLLQSEFLPEEIRTVTDLAIYNKKIFLAGSFTDTILFNGNLFTSSSHSSFFLGELDAHLELTGFADLKSSHSSYLSGFAIHPQFGFVLSGYFDSAFSMQSASIDLGNKYERGSFLANLDDSLMLRECHFIEGGTYGLKEISIWNQQISGTAFFSGTCNFQNASCFAFNTDISTFQTSAMNVLQDFKGDPFHSSLHQIPLEVKIYPNPFEQSFSMEFSEPVYSNALFFTNALGQYCLEIELSPITETQVKVDASRLAPGIYFLKYLTCSGEAGTYKLVKE
ncbi:MAG: T9SS type A sorting domain-containing protein [Bacteroidota bacterium]|nr:T9SS type A sorting domain-containing protein [Bacteroidota bacterium]MDX5430685.1 T9SS type A sorting domain-containing protein [Bacteroidota bacterium]